MMKQKKGRRMRGTRRHGWGKHHRGKGNRGGKGNSGRGKRAAHKKPSYRDTPLGKFGFKTHRVKLLEHTISFREIMMKLESWKKQNLVEEKNGIIHVDLGKLGYTKLLGTGKLTKKMKLSVPSASKRAVEKITAAGGESA